LPITTKVIEATSTIVLSFLSILIIDSFASVIPMAFAKEVITILPGAQDHTRPRFLDITFYPIGKGQELTWFNDDGISHRIIINLVTQNNSTELVADSEIINPDNSFTYTFEEEGTYHFSSPNYPWIKGIVFVSDDDISTTTQTDSKNDIDVQLSWTPSSPKIGQETHFKIVFINKETEENQKHIDYRVSIQDSDGKKIDLQSPHSGWGVESASYTFEKEGEFKPMIYIFDVNFIPVEVGLTEFELVTSATKG
jgi:hypothetical protein